MAQQVALRDAAVVMTISRKADIRSGEERKRMERLFSHGRQICMLL